MSNPITIALYPAQQTTIQMLPPEGGTLRLVAVSQDTLALQLALGAGAAGNGDMTKAVYDTNADGVVNQAAVITGQGDAATRNVGTSAGTVAAGDHTHAALYQPLDADLTAIGALTPSNDDTLQFIGGVWANRTAAQVRATLDLEAGTDFLSPAAIAAAYQPLDSDLTAIAALADPNADRILFWDDSAGAYKHLTAGTGLTITDTTIEAAGAGANTALSNLASVAINTTLLPGSNDGAALGSGTLSFSDMFLADGGIINWGNGTVTIEQSSNDLTFRSTTGAGCDYNFYGDSTTYPSVNIGGDTFGVGRIRISDDPSSGGGTSGALLIDADTLSVAGSTWTFSGVSFTASGELSAGTFLRGDELRLYETSGAGSQTLSIFASEIITANRTLNFEVGDTDRTVTFGGSGTYQPSGASVIASGSFDAANTHVFSTTIPETYAYLVLEFTGLSSNTATRYPRFQVSVDAGSTWDTTASNYPGYVISAVQNGGTAVLATNDQASLAGSMTGVAAASTFTGVIEIFNYQGTLPHFRGHVLAGAVRNEFSGEYIGSTLNIDGLRMIWNNTGNSDAGTWVLKGYA